MTESPCIDLLDDATHLGKDVPGRVRSEFSQGGKRISITAASLSSPWGRHRRPPEKEVTI